MNKREEKLKYNKLLELYNAAGGRRSHYIFLDSEPKDFINNLKEEDYIKYVKNGSNKEMYTITEKLIRIFRVVSKDEEKQLNYEKVILIEDNHDNCKTNTEL